MKKNLAMSYKEQARYEKAGLLLIQALEGRRLKLSDTHPHTLQSWNNLIALYEAWNKPEKANGWRAKLTQIEGFEEWQNTFKATHFRSCAGLSRDSLVLRQVDPHGIIILKIVLFIYTYFFLPGGTLACFCNEEYR
jgi:hypothetical protein